MPSNQNTTFKSAFALYKSVRLIGQGGAGRVFEVRDEKGRVFAIKALDSRLVTTNRLGRFRNEIAFCIKAPHPNIVSVVDYGFFDVGSQTVPFYVMPLYQTTLRNLIRNHLSPKQSILIFDQLLDALDVAHRSGVWHRDLKPENVLFNSETGAAVLADFGVAHFSENIVATAVKTKRGDRLANFQYAAPEQRRLKSPVDHRADIFSLGMMLNELFTGRAPLGLGFARIADSVPQLAALDPLVEAMMQDDPARRPQSVAQVRDSFSKATASARPSRVSSDEEVVSGTVALVSSHLVQQAARLRSKIEQKAIKERLWRSHEGVQTATGSAARIMDRIEEISRQLSASAQNLVALKATRKGDELAFEGKGLSAMVVWSVEYGNSLDGSQLEITFWKGSAPLSGRQFFKSPSKISGQIYIPAVDADGQLRWSPKNAKGSIVAEGDVAEYAVSRLLELMDEHLSQDR